jgi:hypothetical protein
VLFERKCITSDRTHALVILFLFPHEELQKNQTTFHIVLMYDFHHLKYMQFYENFF